MIRQRWLAALLLCAATTAAAQSYRWNDSQGRTVISDTPPPSSVGEVSIRGKAAPLVAELPYAARQAAAKHPVTLYTSAACQDECRQARELLKQRGTPFSEKLVATQEDIDALKKLAGEAAVPTVQVGRQVQRGFSSELYHNLLDAAGYPGRRPPAREE